RAVAAAAGSLGVVAALQVNGDATPQESAALIALLAAAIAARILLNQVRSTQARESTERALQEREAALMETDRAIARLQDAMSTLANSEERFRLLFDAAVDGIVELDGRDRVRQANGSFCDMIGLDRDAVIGRPWADVARASRGGDTISSLLTTGQATLDREGHEVFLESRVSSIPGLPPGKLLLVRDVTSAKVADQTIRSLFQFLQDRDEDRTRLLKRTNAAIEAERNRIARDLHDGPVQGVSAASLSLEAVLLMLQGGDVDRAKDTLVKVRGHLSEEADNLRRLMSNLRPPLLEERGLVPALQETLSRFGSDHQIRTRFRSRSLVEVPTDLETLAYRLVQEALTNTAKHADASELSLTVDAVAGQLRIELTDDGTGFDPTKARDFLRNGQVGLASMRERIELANGTFMVRSSPGTGATIVATLPLETVPTQRELASN
ncbi:MAG: PAS domain-containing sensor histidine kinase, partial [Actinomycetota bacterium]